MKELVRIVICLLVPYSLKAVIKNKKTGGTLKTRNLKTPPDSEPRETFEVLIPAYFPFTGVRAFAYESSCVRHIKGMAVDQQISLPCMGCPACLSSLPIERVDILLLYIGQSRIIPKGLYYFGENPAHRTINS